MKSEAYVSEPYDVTLHSDCNNDRTAASEYV